MLFVREKWLSEKIKDETINILRETIEECLKNVHIETGRKDDFEKVVNKLEAIISKKVLMMEVSPETEKEKNFKKYLFLD